jgi:hypothetical protein
LRARVLSICLLILWSFAGSAPAASESDLLQFDLFLGYEGVVPQGSWFPLVCEIKNEGAPFIGTVEITPANNNPGFTRREVVELPTGTLKRLSIPVFASSSYSRWDVRLSDERGRLRKEQTGLAPRRLIGADTPMLGAMPRSASGTPSLRPVLPRQTELQPGSARMMPLIFPDNPLVLEGLSAVYLNSEKASDLRVTQVNALLAWLNAGGHLIVGVEQVADVGAAQWLKNIFPCDLKELKPLARHPEFQEWLQGATWSTRILTNAAPRRGPALLQRRYGVMPGAQGNRPVPQPPSAQQPAEPPGENPLRDLVDDFTFEAAEMQVATATVRDGVVRVAAGDTPLIVTAARGRGRVTALLFSPEREPFRSWKNLPTFWAKLVEVPATWYASGDFNQQGGWGSDGVFGAMIESRQVHKLPIEWLLLLLVIYLVVIGPLDQFWLKKIGRPMLTWITFPTYVVCFSLLIYFIGYKLRAGESEWNELHIVDVLQNGERAELRGRTYASVYSPVNQRYALESQQKVAAFRGEFVGMWGGGQSGERATVWQNGDSFKAEIFVPVWTSQLFVSDWWQSAALPLAATVQPQGDGWLVTVENRSDQKLGRVQIVIGTELFVIGELRAGETKPFTAVRGKGMSLGDFVARYGSSFQQAVQYRQRAFGSTESGHIDDLANTSVAACFLSQLSRQQGYVNFVASPGLDVSSMIEHGNAVLFGWDADYSPVQPFYHFNPRRTHKDTLWRVTVPLL